MQNVSFDMYLDTENGSEYYGTFKPENVMTEEGMYESVIHFGSSESRNVTIYFPVLNPVADVYVGVAENASIGTHTLPYADTGKIVWYGSSITQGGSVSSPGKTYAAEVSRNLNKDFINLGFWGSAKGQKEIANYIASMDDIGVFVLDYDHNENDASVLKTRHLQFYQIVREAHPNIPIIMISRPNHQADNWEELRDAIRTNYNTAVANGDTNVYFIDGQTFFEDADYNSCLMDGVHPSDLGAGLIAEGILSFYRNHLGTKEFRFSKEITLQDSVNTVDILAQDANSEDTTITFHICKGDEIVMIDENFDSYQNGDKPISTENGWKITNADAVVTDGRLFLNKTADLYAKESFVDGCVSADITIEEVSDTLKQAEVGKAVYPVELTARKTLQEDMHEFRARFEVKKVAEDEYSTRMQVIVYSKTDYGTTPQIYSFNMADFTFGKTYNLKITCVGNYFAVEMDGAVMYEGACSTEHGLYNHKGTFGAVTRNETAAVTLDNIKIVKYIPRQLTIAEECSEEIFAESFKTLKQNGKETYRRTAYRVGEHVKINVVPKQGYSLDKDSLQYTTQVGTTPIVECASEVLYGFFMPKYDVVVSAQFVQGGGSAKDIYFTEDFDGENSLIDNGWDYGGNIWKGALALDVDEVGHAYLTGFYSANAWSDYVVEADVRLTDENVDHNMGVASISARTSGGSTGYEFGIQAALGSQKGTFRLYNRTTRTMMAQAASNLAERDTTYHLKMVLQGNRILCFVDGQLMFDVTDAAGSNTAGSIGLRSLGASGDYDNIVVRAVRAGDLEGITSSSTIVGGNASTGGSNTLSPGTGDTAQILRFWLLLVASAALVVVCGIVTYKSKHDFKRNSRRNEG